jgi:hypothetical protein
MRKFRSRTRWNSGSVFFLAVEGRVIEVGAGGRKGDESGVMAMSWMRVVAAGGLPGVCGAWPDVRSSGFAASLTSCRSASYGDG